MASGRSERTAIRTGRFDPKTGVLKLEGEAQAGDGAIEFAVEATLDHGSLTGSFAFGQRRRPFTFTTQ